MCYNPMIAIKTGVVNPETGKPQYKFLKSVKKWYNDDMQAALETTGDLDERLSWDGLHVDLKTGEVFTRPVILPCGQCLQCRCQYAQQWATRIMLEAQYHEHSYMITLTYDDEHVPRTWPYEEHVVVEHYDPKTGKMIWHPRKVYRGDEVMSLDPDDLQAFVKRLRRYQEFHFGNTIRYYGVGEYGSQYHRPHYHIIVFGLILDDIVEIGRNAHGTILHDSATIRRIWGKGITEVSPVTWQDAAYCARYTTKKLGKAETDFYKENCLVPEFTRMSLKPAIGAQYYQDHKDEIYKYDKIHLSTVTGGRTVKPPRYYDKLYDDVYPTQMAEVRGNRQELAKAALQARVNRFDGNYLELLEQEEDIYKTRTKSLMRNLE